MIHFQAAVFLLYICIMKIVNLSKHALTVIAVISLVYGLIQFFTLDVTHEKFGDHIIFGTFFSSLFVLTATYRIDWIGRQKINWISFGLFVISLSGLLIMLMNPKNVMALWKPTVASYILLCGFVFFLKLNRKNWSAIVAKAFLSVTTALFLFPLLIQTSDLGYYSISWISLLLTALFSILNLILPEKQG